MAKKNEPKKQPAEPSVKRIENLEDIIKELSEHSFIQKITEDVGLNDDVKLLKRQVLEALALDDSLSERGMDMLGSAMMLVYKIGAGIGYKEGMRHIAGIPKDADIKKLLKEAKELLLSTDTDLSREKVAEAGADTVGFLFDRPEKKKDESDNVIEFKD